ncbi:unnamed protein product [Adineta steineri]|uniref:Uncharacterized protein n=1 Tax=Adineta steineri TaxID=433720 RepID=A0A813SEQ9_9BILA|nr:unnamed protein product [Adineta steineri]CAF0794116.1 unnamed protein product [Adineta steineri]
MLFHLFVIFSLYKSISCQISCYACSNDSIKYDYIITAENIPTELNNCPIKNNQYECAVDIRWFLSSNTTEVDIVTDSRKRELAPADHTVTVDAIFGSNGLTQEIYHSLYYFCSTDKCNSASELKRLLLSLTLKDQLMELKDLLKPSEQFDGHWCLFFSNQTAEPCDIPVTVDPNNCKQCSAKFTTEPKTNTICAGCYNEEMQKDFLGREILFNLTDRTRTEIRMINCRSNHCNEIHTGDLIRQKCAIDFDFVKFLNTTIQVQSQTCNGISQYEQCSTNSACACFTMTDANDTGICALLSMDCASLLPCDFSNNTCHQSNTMCVRHPRCHDHPVCYPKSMIGKEICPPVRPSKELHY